MIKTLDQYTADERAEMVGMWAEDKHGDLVLIAGVDWWTAFIFNPRGCCMYEDYSSKITPRFDLPRAWNADGTPPAGRYEALYTDAADKPAPGPNERRWISEWEPTP